jgi:2-oxoglutarate ferredoxin oxidoreductase subunit beta
MASEHTRQWIDEICGCGPRALDDYQSEPARWCMGCGDHGVLTALQRLLLSRDVAPESVVVVSGIGCSSRMPHYIKTYGFHTIHGRALPVATGITLARPDLRVIVVMGDGDCFSIGGNHWLHAIRYNINAMVLVLDNEIYALTKNQASPTTPAGRATNTTPRGALLGALNPLSVMTGMTNLSFLAQSATWYPGHLDAVLARAWEHHGLGFVRILQRCPVYMADAFGGGGHDHPAVFLEHERGIPVDPATARRAGTRRHDPADIHAARQVAHGEHPAPMGLLYHNPALPAYSDLWREAIDTPDRATYQRRLADRLDRYAINA